MTILTEITGIDYAGIVQLTAFFVPLFSFCVCFGIALYDIFNSIAGITAHCIVRTAVFISDHLPHIRKERGVSHADRKH